MMDRLVWGAPQWLWPAAILAALALWAAWRSYRNWPAGRMLGWLAGVLKGTAIVAVAVALCQPLLHLQRPKTGANEFWIVADNSASLQIKNSGQRETRGEQVRKLLAEGSWRTRLEQDFVVRRFQFSDRLRSISAFDTLDFQGVQSRLAYAIQSLSQRVSNRPCAGILLVTDGTSTDSADALEGLERLAPIYPVLASGPLERDVAIGRVQVTQSNFEAAPVTISCQLRAVGVDEPLVVQLLDHAGKVLEETEVQEVAGQGPPRVRFRFRPREPGISFYRLRAFAQSDISQADDPREIDEATTENNHEWVVVDRGGGPYRVLYVAGRPHWEYKFLRRAIEEDEEVQLEALIRVARREPKFEFRSRGGGDVNPFYEGFDPGDVEEVQRYDEPVLLRIDTREGELVGGFPHDEKELFAYHALILDDVEAEFFTTDQQLLIREFVSRRGGALAMLAGPDSFADGKYADTPVGELLPVYLDPQLDDAPGAKPYHFALTREGWLEPWVRLRDSQPEEEDRLDRLSPLLTLGAVRGPKPGAMVLAEMVDANANPHPFLVSQRFGRGKSVAVLGGDLWRWKMRASKEEANDLPTLWRQLMRWMMADVPPRLAVQQRRLGADVELDILVLRPDFHPAAEAEVEMEVKQPDGTKVKVTAQPQGDLAGRYRATFTPGQSGAYLATVTARVASEVQPLIAQTGWTAAPQADEFGELEPNRALLEQLASRTGGRVLMLDELNDWVEDLPTDRIPIVESWHAPLWHGWWWLVLVMGCLSAEWALRRWHGTA